MVEIDKKNNTKKVFLPSYTDNYSGQRLTNEDRKRWDLNSRDFFNYGNWSDLRPFQDRVKSIWEKRLGFEVRFVHADFNVHVQKGGSLACMVNCINRS